MCRRFHTARLLQERSRELAEAREKFERANHAHAKVSEWAANVEADATRQLSLMLQALKREKADVARLELDLQGAELRAKEREADALRAHAEVAKFREARS